jgi:DNA-binding IclR family transcriptional regulator
LIEQVATSGRYRLGPGALQIGLASLHQLDPIEQATAVAQDLAQTTGQTVIVALWANLGPTVVRMIESPQPLHVNMRLGTVMSILGTATGRAFAAHLPRAALVSAMGHALGEPARANRTLLNNLGNDLDTELVTIKAEVATHGVTRAKGRPIPGVNAFSAAAFGHDKRVALVITALGHQDTFAAHWNSPIAKSVQQAALLISQRLGATA